MVSACRSTSRLKDAAPLLAVTALAFGVRLSHVIPAGFPLNDGGMFAAASNDIAANSWSIPKTMSCNGSSIPFGYPPLGFYLTAILSSATGLSTIAALRVIPIVASGLTVPAVYFLLRTRIDRQTALLATLVFALLPRSFDWELSGGGVTRSVGILFAILALHQLSRISVGGPRAAALLAGLFGGLAALSHPEMGLFVLSGGAVLLGMGSRSWSNCRSFGIAGVFGTILVGVWLFPVLFQQGPDGLLSAGRSGQTLSLTSLRVLSGSAFDEPFFPIFTALGFAGMAKCLVSGPRLFPVWLLVILVVDPRKAPTLAAVPISAMAAIAINQFFLPLFDASDLERARSTIARSPAQRTFLYVVFGFGLVAACLAGFARNSPLFALSSANRDAMAWVRLNTPPEARFLVVSGQEQWALDASSEWFPYLADRRSVATVQGSEWLGAGRLEEQSKSFEAVQQCHTVLCIEQWRFSHDEADRFEYLFVSGHGTIGMVDGNNSGCCLELQAQLALDPRYERAFESKGASVFLRLPEIDSDKSQRKP